jgi:hypothetical protein
VTDADAHVALGKDDAVGTDPLEDLPVRLRHRLGDDARDRQVDEDGGREDAVFDVRADGDDGRREVGCPELAHGLDVRGIRLDDVRQTSNVLLHELSIRVHSEDLVAQLNERLGEIAAETAQADDQEFLVLPSQ